MELYQLVPLIIIFVWVLIPLSSFRVVQTHERLVVNRLGKFVGVRGPGMVLLLPVVERAVKVDLREQTLVIGQQTITTRDEQAVEIEFALRYRVVDPQAATMTTTNLNESMSSAAVSAMRSRVSKTLSSDLLHGFEHTSEWLYQHLEPVFKEWSVQLLRIDIGKLERSRPAR